MSRDAAMPEERLLMELAELGLRVAERLHDAVMATHDPDQLAALGTAFHQVGRGVRQSLALKARFAAGTVVLERAARSEARPAGPAPAPPRAAERTGWNEYERLDCDELLEELDTIADHPEGEPLDLERTARVLEAAQARIRSDLTVVSRSPLLAAIPTLRPEAARLAGRAALLGGTSALRVVDSS